MSKPEDLLAAHLKFHKVEAHPEYRFGAIAAGGPGRGLRDRLARAGLRDWRFDFAFPAEKVAVEIEGGAWTGGRHTTGTGFSEDLKKYDAAMRLGWSVYRCDPGMVRSGRAIETILMLLKLSKGETA